MRGYTAPERAILSASSGNLVEAKDWLPTVKQLEERGLVELGPEYVHENGRPTHEVTATALGWIARSIIRSGLV